jgi:glycosyltransferase involved in cell wall biosynthesis
MENNKLKTLVILSPGFPKNEADTTCLPPQQLFVKALKEVCPSLNIIVLTFHYPFVANEYMWYGIKVIAIGGKDKGRSRRMLTWIKAWLILKKLNKEHHLAGLLSFWFGECAFVGDYFAKRYQLIHYSWLLGQDAKKGNKYFNWVKPHADMLIALSDFIVKEVKKNYGITPQKVIPVGIDTSLFSDKPAERNIDIVGAGSLIPLKQYHIFIETIKSLKEFFPDIKAQLIGNGPEMNRLRALINSQGLEQNIKLTGELPHTEVLKVMQQSKVFLHTSNYEGFGAVCLEALYAGAHVVSFVRPMAVDIENWNIAASKDMMLKLAKDILQYPAIKHQSVLPYTIQANAEAALKLFGY